MTQDEQIEAAWINHCISNFYSIKRDDIYFDEFKAGFIAGQSAPKLEDEKSCCGSCEGCRE